MANVNEARQANMGSNNGGKTDWQKQLDMLSMAALAQGANPATMAGFALGKWLSGYLGRGQDNKDRKIRASLENGGSTTSGNTTGSSTTGGSTTSNTGAGNLSQGNIAMNGGNGGAGASPTGTYDLARDLTALRKQQDNTAPSVIGGNPGGFGYNMETNKMEYIPVVSGLMGSSFPTGKIKM